MQLSGALQIFRAKPGNTREGWADGREGEAQAKLSSQLLI